jgi:hypothetical protein
MAASLFKAVLGLINKVPEGDSAAFMRFALRFADMLLAAGPIYVVIFETSITRLTKLTTRATIYRDYFCFWLSARIGTIAVPTCLSMLTRQSSMSISTFELLDAIAQKVALEHVHLLVVYLSRCLIQKMTWARTPPVFSGTSLRPGASTTSAGTGSSSTFASLSCSSASRPNPIASPCAL